MRIESRTTAAGRTGRLLLSPGTSSRGRVTPSGVTQQGGRRPGDRSSRKALTRLDRTDRPVCLRRRRAGIVAVPRLPVANHTCGPAPVGDLLIVDEFLLQSLIGETSGHDPLVPAVASTPAKSGQRAFGRREAAARPRRRRERIGFHAY